MKFIVDPSVFEKLPNVCFGVVIAKGIDNKNRNGEISNLLANSIIDIKSRLGGVVVKELNEIAFYRNAFQSLGFNPNKFLPSVEALITRVVKGGQIPSINNVVDLVNAVSIKYLVPIGAHDIDSSSDDIEVRFSAANDVFIPFGSDLPDNPDPGELVYVRGSSIKTRRWIWRQSDIGKITELSSNIFFPIDGFRDNNLQSVLAARDAIFNFLKDNFNCEISSGLVDVENQSLVL